MKQFRVTVNGQVYEVVVEEVGTTTKAQPQAFVTTPVVQPVATPAPAAAAAPKTAPITTSGSAVTAPMPGVVLSLAVTEGQRVDAGDIVIILEAMKMENEITSPVSGTVKQIAVHKGANVNTGDVMVVIE